MSEKFYSLESILASISTYKKQNVSKRLLFDKGAVGGMSNKWIIGFFIALPFLEYAAIFNPYIFNKMGIAQAIIFFVVFLSIIMIFIFLIFTLNNASVVKTIRPSWEHYFPEIDLNLIVTSGATPYKDFYKFCTIAFNQELKGEALYTYLKEAFVTMQEQNKELIAAMKNARPSK